LIGIFEVVIVRFRIYFVCLWTSLFYIDCECCFFGKIASVTGSGNVFIAVCLFVTRITQNVMSEFLCNLCTRQELVKIWR